MTTRSPKILLVDDSEICRETTKYQLAAYGYDVIALDSPFGFGVALGKEQPDLVLVDAQMPALTGDKLVEIARRNRLCSCPIVIYSDRPDLDVLAASCGAAGFIPKTADARELVRAIGDFLSRPPESAGASSASMSSPSRSDARDRDPKSSDGDAKGRVRSR